MKYKLPDGTFVDAPEGGLTPEEHEWLKQQGAKPELGFKDKLIDVVNSGMSGFNEGVIRAPFIGGDLFALGARGLERVLPGTTSEQNRRMMSDDVLNALHDSTGFTLHNPETTAGRYASSIGNAVGGGVLGGSKAFTLAPKLGSAPGLGNAVKEVVSRVSRTPLAQNAAVGATAEFAGDVSRGFDENKSQNPLVRGGAAAATALLAALNARMHTPNSVRPLYEATKDMKPEDWAAAQRETARLQAAGATQNTVGDSLPPTSQVAPIEREISNTVGGQPLHQKLVGRSTGDIPTLLNQAKTTAQAASVPNMSVLPNAVGNAEETMDQFIARVARGNRSTALKTELQNAPPVPTQQIVQVIKDMRAKAMNPANRGTVDADYLRSGARTIAGVPLYRQPIPPTPAQPRASGFTPVTPLGPQPGPGVPPGMPVAPQGLPPPGAGPALPPPSSTSMVPAAPQAGGALDPSRTIPRTPDSTFQMPQGAPDITTIEQSIPRGANLEALSKIVKSLETKTPKTSGPAAGQLDSGAAMLASNAAQRKLRAVNPNYNAAMEAYAGLSPQAALTDLLAKNKLTAMPNPQSSSLAADQVRAEIAAQLQKINPAAGRVVGEKLRTADILSRNTAERGVENLGNQLGQSTGAAVVAPFSALARKFNISGRIAENKDLARLLANPTPENYRILEGLSRTDPELAKLLSVMSNAGAVNAATQTEGY